MVATYTYRVQPGDTLSAIASRAGVSLSYLESLNPQLDTGYNGSVQRTFDTLWHNTAVYIPTSAKILYPNDGVPNSAASGGSGGGTGGRSVPAGLNGDIPGTNTTNPTPPSLDQMVAALSGPERDAYTALNDLFSSYGLSSLAPTILQFVQQGYSQDTISIMLQSTPQYEQRFAGNQIRLNNGLSVLSPADYMSLEASYYQILQSSGLPSSFYNNPSDWTNWIGNDVSPTEVQARVSMAQQATLTAPPDLVQALGKMGVPTGSLVAYFLDDTKALPIIQQQFNAAQIGAAALRNGLAMDPARATTFANMGITVSQANAAYQQIGQTLPTLDELGSIYSFSGGWKHPYTQTTAENNLLMGNAQAALQTQKLEDTEKAAFSGTGGVGQQALATAPPPTGAGKY